MNGEPPELGVSPATPIKRSKVGNIDSLRLQRRRDRLAVDTRLNSRQFASRMQFAYRAAELMAVENEIDRRGEMTEVRFSNPPASQQVGSSYGSPPQRPARGPSVRTRQERGPLPVRREDGAV